jgi:predicted site-specific integrase-resolvase
MLRVGDARQVMTDLLTHDQAAERIGVCAKTLRQFRKQGLIRYIAVTRRKISYRAEDVEAFIESRATVDVPNLPTERRRRQLRQPPNVISFTARRQERMAAQGR